MTGERVVGALEGLGGRRMVAQLKLMLLIVMSVFGVRCAEVGLTRVSVWSVLHPPVNAHVVSRANESVGK